MNIPESEMLDSKAGASADEVVRTPDTPKKELSPREALEKLRKGEPLQNVRIERLIFRGEFPEAVELRNVTLVFPRFEKVTFKRSVSFAGCTLISPKFSPKTVFEMGLNLHEATLIKAGFNGVTVKGSLRCDNLETHGLLKIIHTRFEGMVRLWEARFHGWVHFTDCEFLGQADFRSFHAEEGMNLNRCHFKDEVLLRGATVCKKLDLSGSRFEGMLDLSKAKLHDFVYVESIEQGEKQRFAFYNTVTERMLIRPDQLEGRVDSEERGDYLQAMHEYGFLKRVFHELHRFHEEDWAYYRFKVNHRRCCQRSWRRPWTKLFQAADWLILDQGCGYGTNPFRAIRAALIIILMFALIYMAGIDHFNIAKEQLPFPVEEPDSLANRIVFGLTTSAAVFTAGFECANGMGKGWMNLPLMIESMLGLFLWGLFIVAFSRKVIRE